MESIEKISEAVIEAIQNIDGEKLSEDTRSKIFDLVKEYFSLDQTTQDLECSLWQHCLTDIIEEEDRIRAVDDLLTQLCNTPISEI